MGEFSYHSLQSRKDSRGWAFFCSLLAHAGAIVALGMLLNAPRPTVNLPGPIKVDLISMPAAPKVQRKPLKPPTSQEPVRPQLVKKIVTPTKPNPPVKAKSLTAKIPDLVVPVEQTKISASKPAEILSHETSNAPQEEIQPIENLDRQVASTTEPGAGPSPTPSSSMTTDAIANYSNQIRERIDKVKRYPMMARKAGKQGSVVVEFSVDRNGKLLSSQIAKSCGIKQLDRAAINALKRASPFTPLPESLASPHVFNLQINFFLAG